MDKHRAEVDRGLEFESEPPTLAPTHTILPATIAVSVDSHGEVDSNEPAPAACELGPALSGHERYRISEKLGAGAMGSVYKAEHRLMRRPVALKVINSEYVGNPAMVERFHREVRAAATLSHPNIVAAYDAEHVGDAHFLVMEFVEGSDLSRLVKRRGPLPVAEACDYVSQAARGLQHAWERGMVHRDIKPQNLMLTNDRRVKVLDFGLAHFISESVECRDLTEAGSIMGTPDYMAPEQARDPHSADTRADVYSLGCTLYFLLTGRPPYTGKSPLDKVLAHIQQVPRPLTDFRADVPADLERTMLRMLSKQPEQRFQTPGEVAEALAPWSAPSAASQPRPGRPPSSRLLWTAVGVLLALGLGGLAFGVFRISTDQGTVVIRTDDPDVKVLIRQGGEVVRIIDLKTKQQIELRSGEYQVELGEGANGLTLSTNRLTLSRGDKQIVEVVREEPARPGALQAEAPGQQAEALKQQASVPLLQSPAAGAEMQNGAPDRKNGIEWRFDWSDTPNATRYHLWVMGANARIPVVSNDRLTVSEYVHRNPGAFVIDRHQKDWRWKVRAEVDGRWNPWSNERSFSVRPMVAVNP